MPTRSDFTPNDEVSLLINGQAHSQWESYEIDSDLMIPSDAWSVEIGLKNNQLPDFVQPWAQVEVKVGNDTILHGRVDEITDSVDKRNHTLTMSGRDYAAILVDCAAPIFNTRSATLAEVAAKVVRPLGLNKIEIKATKTAIREKITVEPGDRAWDVLQHAAEANGLWPWFASNGTLIIGGPDYSVPPVATLIMRRNGKGNNVESITRTRNVTDHFSPITVLGQTHGTESTSGKNNIKGEAKDSAANFNRPQIITDHEVDNQQLATNRARKLMADSMLSAFDLHITVSGHRILPTNKLWEPGQRVQVESEPHGIKGIFFLMGRKFSKSRDGGTRTQLRLKQDGLWTLDAYPHKRRYRKGKNSSGAGEIIVPEISK